MKSECVLKTVLCLMLLFCPGAWSARSAANSDEARSTNAVDVDIDALVNEVLKQNPELNFSQAEIAAAKGGRRGAAVWANPDLSIQAGRKHARSGGVSEEGVAWAVGVQQTFEWPGRIPLRKAIADHQVQLAELGFGQFKAALAARTRHVGGRDIPLAETFRSWISRPIGPFQPSNQCKNLPRSAAAPTYRRGGTASK
jgi:cobalt-zinc-cadmium efflux system outer membrane protein